MRNILERIQSVLAADFSLGNRTAATPHATVVTNPEFPLLPECNLVHTVRLDPNQGAADLLAEVEERLQAAGTPWRHVVLDPEARPVGLARDLEVAGFAGRQRAAAAYVAPPLVEEQVGVEVRSIAGKSAWAQLRGLRRAILEAEGRAGEEAEQYAALLRRRSLSSNVRFFLGLLEFEPVAHVGLLSVGRTGLIVDLAVRQDRRGRGIGRGLLRRMVEHSRSLGHDLTCAVHDEGAPAQRLFARAGFVTAGSFLSFVRRAPAGAPPSTGAEPAPHA